MAIVQCSNNHYYDNKRNKTCPYCEKMKEKNPDSGINEQFTSLVGAEDDNAQLTEAYGENINEFEKTIGIFLDDSQNVLTVAWLVCIKGAEKGKSYVVHSGRNFAGSSCDMDIVISGDESIKNQKHFSIVFDPKSCAFFLVCGEGHAYLNDEPVLSQSELNDGDIISIGDIKYMFVPFCKEGRDWN